MRNRRKGSHTVHDVKVHLVWVTKYRYKVLIDQIARRVRELIRQTCEVKDIRIIRGHVSPDHVHLFISYPPKLCISEIVKALKGRSSVKIQLEYPEIGKRYWGKHFWAIGYAAFSSGEVTEEIIKEYISNHVNDEKENFTVG